MQEPVTAVVVTALFVGSGRYAVTRWMQSRSLAARTDYALHAFMAIAMILMSWIPLPDVLGIALAVAFAGTTAWFLAYAVRGVGAATTTRFRLLAAYHAFMMATMTLMVAAMGSRGQMSSMPGMDGSMGGHEMAGSATRLGETMTVLGIALGVVAVFWIIRAIGGLRRDSPRLRRRLCELRLYEFAMALGMAVMSLSHHGF